MKALGWIAAAIGGFILFNSFKGKTTSLVPGGNETYSPPREGTVNKDIAVDVTSYPPQNTNLSGLAVETKKLSAGTKVNVTALKDGFYTITMPNYGVAQVKQEDITFNVSYNPIDIIKDVSTTPGTGSGATKTTETPQLPPDEYTAYPTVKYGKTRWDIPGMNGFPYLNQGTPVKIHGYKKHYAFNSLGLIVSTDLLDIEYNLKRREVQQEAIIITVIPIVTGNVESFTGTDKYNPYRSARTNKATSVYNAAGEATPVAANINMLATGKGVARTNKFSGTYQNIDVYTVQHLGKGGFVRVADLTLL